jgi:membrane fusion protein (multidrug efflux system)
MKKNIKIAAVLVVIVAGWLWFRHRGAGEAAGEAAPATRVETAPLRRRSIAETLNVFGVIGSAPSAEATIAAPYDCVIRQIDVGPGAHVAAGDELLAIDPSPDTKLAFDSARSAQALADKALAAAQERYDLKLATSQDLLAAQQAADDARFKSASFAARGLGGDGKIIASAAGVVSKLDWSAGSFVAAGTTLVAVAAADRLEARLGVEAADLARVGPGQVVTLVSANRPDAAPIQSVVRAAGGAIDSVTGSAEVRVPLPPGAPLLAGEHVSATIEVKKDSSAFVVPRRAVLPDGDKFVLFTVKSGKAVRHEVGIGVTSGDLVEVIADDLVAGDAVVTLGNYELEDGMAVQASGKTDQDAGENKP